MAQRNIDQIISGDIFTTQKSGDVPAPGQPVGGTQRFLREDATWQPGSGVTGGIFTTTLDGLVPHPGSVTQKVLRDDATWVAQPVIPGVFTTSTNGLAPASGSVTGKFLGDNGSWNVLPTFTTTVNGVVPAPGSTTGKVLSDSGAWVSQPVVPGVFGTNTNGLVPFPGSTTGKVLTDAGTWADNSNAFTTSKNGMVPTPGSATGKVLSDSGTWVVNGSGAGAGGAPTDWFNVKTQYGAVGNGSHDDTTNIQNAINAAIAAKGGVVYFPAGFYHTTASLTEAGGGHFGIRLVGCGGPGSAQDTWGTVIQGSFNDYILKSIHQFPGTTNGIDSCSIGSIEGIGFRNDNTTAADLTSTEGGSGCVYLSGDLNMSVRNCAFAVNTGIGFAHVGQNVSIDGCNFTGGFFPGNHFGRSVAMFIMNGRVSNCNISGSGIGIMCAGTQTNGGSSLSADKVDIQDTGVALMLGHTTLTYWDLINNNVVTALDNAVQYGHISNISTESCGGSLDGSNPFNAVAYCYNIGNLIMDHCFWGAFGAIGTASYGVYLKLANNCSFDQFGMQGTYSVAAFYLSHVYACKFSQISAGGSAPLTWRLQGAGVDIFGIGEDGNTFSYCPGTDGGLPINSGGYNNFPLCPNTPGQTYVCTDSATALAGNVGTYISAISTTNATTAGGNNTLHFASGHVPSQIANGWQVWDVTVQNGAPLGTVSSTTATTVVMNAGSAFAVGNGDVMAFTNGGGTNKVTVRWNGDRVAGTGGWYIVG